MADGRDLGVAPPDQKPARPASEVVRDPDHFSARTKGEGPKDPAAHKGRGPKDPASQTLNGVVAPFQAPRKLLRQLLVHEQDRRGHGSSPRRQAVILSRFSFLTQVLVVPPSGCGCYCATPFLRLVRCRSGSQTKKQRLFPYCSLFNSCCAFFHATHFFASQRSPVVGRLPETVKHLTGSTWPLVMGLRSGLTAYFKEEFEAFVSSSCSSVRVRRVP